MLTLPVVLLGIVVVGPFVGLFRLTGYIHRTILGYNRFDKKNPVIYKKWRYANALDTLLFMFTISTILFILFSIWKTVYVNETSSAWPVVMKDLATGVLQWFGYTLSGSIIAAQILILYTNHRNRVGGTWRNRKKIFHIRLATNPNYFNETRNILIIFIAFVVAAIYCPHTFALFPLVIAGALLSAFFLYLPLQPPGLLFLSTSWENKMLLQAKINRTIKMPVASLLNRSDPVTQKINHFGHLYVYRTADPTRWTESVRILMDICPVIVMDTRHITEPVLTEADMIFGNDLYHKALFVVHDDRSSPVLDTFFAGNPTMQVDYWRFSIQDHLFTESELIALLHDIPRLKALVQPKTTATV